MLDYTLNQCFKCRISKNEASSEKLPFYEYNKGMKYNICRTCIILWKCLLGELIWIIDSSGNDHFIYSKWKLKQIEYQSKKAKISTIGEVSLG